MPLEQSISVAGRFADADAIAADLSSPEMLSRIGNAVAQVLKDNFVELNAEKSSGYGGMGGYYEGAARGTGYTTANGYAEVLVKQIGIGMRWLGTDILPGGVLKPKDSKYLAIPNSFSSAFAEVYGRSPTEIGNLKVVFGRQQDGTIGPIALKADEGGAYRQNHVLDPFSGDYVTSGPKGRKIRAPRTANDEQQLSANWGRRGSSSEGEVLFWLVKEVYQAPNPRVVPPMEELEQAGYSAARQWLDHITPTSISINA
jgi:hypothetical protein